MRVNQIKKKFSPIVPRTFSAVGLTGMVAVLAEGLRVDKDSVLTVDVEFQGVIG